MKKIIAVFVGLIFICLMCACGNKAMIDPGNYTFTKIHIDTYHYSGCLTVEKWHDNDTGVEVKTKEVGSIYLSEGCYSLIEGECPFCDNSTEIEGAE